MLLDIESVKRNQDTQIKPLSTQEILDIKEEENESERMIDTLFNLMDIRDVVAKHGVSEDTRALLNEDEQMESICDCPFDNDHKDEIVTALDRTIEQYSDLGDELDMEDAKGEAQIKENLKSAVWIFGAGYLYLILGGVIGTLLWVLYLRLLIRASIARHLPIINGIGQDLKEMNSFPNLDADDGGRGLQADHMIEVFDILNPAFDEICEDITQSVDKKSAVEVNYTKWIKELGLDQIRRISIPKTIMKRKLLGHVPVLGTLKERGWTEKKIQSLKKQIEERAHKSLPIHDEFLKKLKQLEKKAKAEVKKAKSEAKKTSPAKRPDKKKEVKQKRQDKRRVAVLIGGIFQAYQLYASDFHKLAKQASKG